MMFELVQIITAIVIAGTAVVTAINHNHIVKIHLDVNSRMDQLLSLTKTSSHAEGVKDEKERISVPT